MATVCESKITPLFFNHLSGIHNPENFKSQVEHSRWRLNQPSDSIGCSLLVERERNGDIC